MRRVPLRYLKKPTILNLEECELCEDSVAQGIKPRVLGTRILEKDPQLATSNEELRYLSIAIATELPPPRQRAAIPLWTSRRIIS